MKYYIGIDPGKQGGVALIYNGQIVAYTVMPLGGKDIDIPALARWFHQYAERVKVVACIEKVHAMPGQGVTSMFTFGFVTGAIHGILATMEIPYHSVTPQMWKKDILAGTAKDKDAAVDFCLHAYPTNTLYPTERSRTPHTGLADAICIATYASRRF